MIESLKIDMTKYDPKGCGKKAPTIINYRYARK